ncbi:tape measure protein [Vagococcus carniphilus]|uniref:tape measure protein n=1 Tax=Vagococcus carniphilus TaxID=218144 RepID=UPI00288DB51C|nr:tape measure protein [Vagococcus carniphilus]MDT2850181.1 tape measure protein [Vagococcus carniphilus]
MSVKQADVVLNFKMNGAVQMAQTTKQLNTIMVNAGKEYRNQINAMDKNATQAEKLALQEKKLATQLEATKVNVQRLKEAQEISAGKLPGLTEKTTKLKDELEKSKKTLSENKDRNRELSEAYEKSVKSTGKMSEESEKLAVELELSEKAVKRTADQTKDLQKEYDASAKETKKVNKEMSELPGKILDAENSQIKLEKSLKETNEQLKKQAIFSDEAKKRLEKMGKIGEKTSDIGKKLSLAITTPMAAMTAGLIKNGIEVRKFRAQAQIYYEGLYQDTSKAKKQLDDLMTFAKTTPYSYESIVEADQIMQTFGMSTSKSKEVLNALANTIASTGGSSQDLSSLATVMGQIESSGKLSLQDMNQLINAKIPALKIVGNELGLSVMDLRESISSGEVTSEQAIEALTKGLMEGTDGINGATQAYSGALGEVKQQLPGAVDSMKSAFKNLSLELVNEDVFKKLIEAINKITEMVNSGALIPVIKTLSDVVSDVLEGVIGLAEWFTKLSPNVQKMIVTVIALTGLFGPILFFVGKTIVLISQLATIFGTVAAVIGVSQLALIGIIAAIAAVIAAGVLLYQNWDLVVKKAKELGAEISKKWTEIKEATVQKWKEISAAITKSWTDIKQSVSTKVTEVVNDIKEKWNSFIQFFVDLGNNISNSLSNAWNSVKEGAINFWNEFTATLEPYVDFFSRMITSIISGISVVLEAIWLLIKAGAEIAWQAISLSAQLAWEQIKKYIVDPIRSAYDFIVQKFTELGTWLSIKWEEIKLATSIVWQAIKQSIIQPIVDVYNSVTQKLSELWGAMTGKFNEIKNTTTQKWQEIKQAITSKIIEAKNSAVNTAGEIWDGMVKKFNSIVSGTKEKFNLVKDAIVGPLIEARDKVGEVVEAIQDFFRNIKFPTFSLQKSSKTILGKEIEYPSGIDVQWNAKGAIFNRPVVAGYYGGKAQGYGEVPGVSEAAIPLTPENLAAIGNGVGQTMQGRGVEQHFHIGELHADNPSELANLERKMQKAATWTSLGFGG